MTSEAQEGGNALPSPAPTIHEAEPAPGPSGAVLFGPEIDFDQAVASGKPGATW